MGVLSGEFGGSGAWEELMSLAGRNALALSVRYIPGMNDGEIEVRVTERSGRGNAFVEYGGTLNEACQNSLDEWGHRWP